MEGSVKNQENDIIFVYSADTAILCTVEMQTESEKQVIKNHYNTL